jgi:dihydropyrimidine dehydrogenase (NAD+) subunit PreA
MMSAMDLPGDRVAAMGNIDLISAHHIDVIEKRVRILKDEFPNKVIIASIMGSEKEEWQTLVTRLEAAGVDMIECSFSCPQGSMGEQPGAMLAQNVAATRKVTAWVKEAATRVPVVIKITPQVTDIVAVARAVKEGGADGICASNSIPGLTGVDIYSFVPSPNVGGFSTYSGITGPAIKPMTLRTIAEIKRHVDIEITGTGGPVTWRDAVEFMAVGASNVQFATAVMLYGYGIIDDLKAGMSRYLSDMGFQSPMEIVGKALPRIVDHDDLPRMYDLRSRVDSGLCIGCGDCITACRDGGHMAIQWAAQGRLPAISDDYCVGCHLCVDVCPTGALDLVRTTGGNQ